MATATKRKRGRGAIEKRPLDPRRRWFSKVEAAEYLGISMSSIRRLMEMDRKTGKRALRVYNPVPGRTVVKREDLDAYVESCEADAGPRRR